MDTLWHNRVKKHHQVLAKYMRYIINDHTSLIFVVIMGGLLHGYINWTKETTVSLVFLKATVCVVGVLSVKVGSLATLTQSADTYFLSAAGKQWEEYMTLAKRYSMIFPSCIQILVGVVLIPLFERTLIEHGEIIVVIGVILKWQDLHWQLLSLKKGNPVSPLCQWAKWIMYSSVYIFSVYISVWIGIAIAIFTTVTIQYIGGHHQQLYDVDKIVGGELRRQDNIWRGIRWFVDVPISQADAKMTRVLDALLALQSRTAGMYLMERSLVRLPHLMGPMIWQVVIGVGVYAVLPNIYVLMGLSVVIQYMSMIHLIGVYRHVKNVFSLRFVPKQIDSHDVIYVTRKYVLLQSVMLHVCAGIVAYHWYIFVSLFLSIIVIYGGLPLYLSRKIDKMINA